MKIQVTQSHIDRGRVTCTMACPIALAAIDAGLMHPTVTRAYLMQCGRVGTRVRLPEIAVKFIERFDLRKPVGPFEFEINTQPVELQCQ